MSGTSILVGLVSSQAGKMCALVSSTTKEDGRREEVVGLVGSQASKMCAIVSTNVVRMPEEVVRGLACGRLLSPHSLNAPPFTPLSQLKQLRQQLSTTQRLLDSYAARGTAGDFRPTLTPALTLTLTLT